MTAEKETLMRKASGTTRLVKSAEARELSSAAELGGAGSKLVTGSSEIGCLQRGGGGGTDGVRISSMIKGIFGTDRGIRDGVMSGYFASALALRQLCN
jgi:hypothetical protein